MLEKRLRHIGQDHIAKLLEEGASFVSRQRIQQGLDEADMPLVKELTAGRYLYKAPALNDVAPAEIVPASFALTDQAAVYRQHGENLLKKGKVAVLIVAGGQGSRLGIDAPKGIVEVSPVRSKSLFQIHAEKVLALSRKCSRFIPLFIMTSRENDEETRRFFEEHSFFGLNPSDVFFFVQGMLPSVTPEGDLIISQDGGLFMSPDGHGGTLAALRKNGCLEIMEKRGIEEIFFFQVDNPLVFVCDPLFIGLHSMNGAQISSKVVRKRTFDEKVGIIAHVSGKTQVVEYSDMSDEMRYATDDKGGMLYWAGNAAIHMIRRDFVEKLTGTELRLPFHRANKMIPSFDSSGNPTEIQGIKFEAFIFDALPLAEKSVTLEVIREYEFAPVKNRTGEDSLESSKTMQSNLHKSWLKELGIEVDGQSLIEICPLFALEKNDLKERIEKLPKKIAGDTYIDLQDTPLPKRPDKRHTITIKETGWEILIWMGSIVVLVFVVLFAMYSYRSVEREMAQQFNREQGLLAQQTAMGIEQYMHDITNILNLTIHIKAVADGDPEAIRVALDNAYLSLKNKVAFVFWENSEGIMTYHYPENVLPGLEGKDFSFRTYFRVGKELGVPFVSDIIMVGGELNKDIPGRFETFVISFPLKGENNTFNGVIGCAIDLTNITAHYVAPIRPSETGYAWLLDESGMILYHPNPKWIGMNLYDIVLKMEKQGQSISGIQTIRHAMEIMNDGMFEFVFPHYPHTKPVKKLLAFSSVHFLNRRWITVATSPYSEVIYLMSDTFKNTLILGSASIMFVIIATVVLLRINKARATASERNKWAERVLVAHKRLETIFNGVPHYLAMIDSAFFMADANQRLCDLYGKKREDVIDKHCLLDFPENERMCHLTIVERCFKTGQIITERDRRVDIHGKPFFFDISAIPLFDNKGEVDHVVQYAVDITDKKALTEKLIQAEKLAAVGQMSAHVAHEIRNPLTSVLLHSELLEDEIREHGANEEAQELIGIIRGEIDRLSEITEEYLSYARLPLPKKQLVDPEAEVASVVSMLLPEIKRRNIEIEIKCPDKLPKIMIDRGQFKQLLINLIKNAEDAMPSGGELEISLMRIKDSFILLVKDTGYGVPQELTRRIFDPYFTTKDNGTGLGLALVQYIASVHDGWVDVESQKGTGSTFIFSIPFPMVQESKEAVQV